ncbi:hypothetical protein CWM47_36185 [Spirosoma pollinicola]|uniref:Uncharacterized protein n=1 Tax=Spirosoma pollinicola TaxID=2057025 RepID=A0A2K8ZAC3_9BACT|nr:hypothetical protein CWM47_36185 [Spirosoma pollinicola]
MIVRRGRVELISSRKDLGESYAKNIIFNDSPFSLYLAVGISAKSLDLTRPKGLYLFDLWLA